MPPRGTRGRVDERSGRGAYARMRRRGPDATFSRVFGRFFRSRRALDAVRRTRARTNRSSFPVWALRSDRLQTRQPTATGGLRGGARRAPRTEARAAIGSAGPSAREPHTRRRPRPRPAPDRARSPSRPFEKMPLDRAPISSFGRLGAFRFFARARRAETDRPCSVESIATARNTERFSCRSRAFWSWRRR